MPAVRRREPLVRPPHRRRHRGARAHLPYQPDARPALADVDLAVAAGQTVAGRRTGFRQVDPAVAAAAPLLPAEARCRRRIDVRPTARHSARRHCHGAAGDLPLLAEHRREHRRGTAGGEPRGDAEAAELAGWARTSRAPQGLDTLVGERGITLSGGRSRRGARPRAAAARTGAAARRLPVGGGHPDRGAHPAQPAAVFRGRTVFLVSHRISAVRDADQILVLDDGRIAERGNHRELVRAAPLRRPRPPAELEESLAAI